MDHEGTTVTLRRRSGDRAGVLDALEAFGARHRIPASDLRAVELAVEELVTNILNYGYEDDLEHEIQFRFDFDGRDLTVEISDDARPFDPTHHPKPDIDLSLDEKPIGGLGIHMARQSVDAMTYRRENGRNIVRLKKNVALAG